MSDEMALAFAALLVGGALIWWQKNRPGAA